MSSTPAAMQASISDLSYRNYDGVLESPTLRWWVIAKQMILQAVRKKSLWVLTVMSAWYFVIMAVIMFFVQQVADTTGNRQQLDAFFANITWKDQFLHGFSFAQLLLLIVALIVGAGTIANDNRANALLVYLSKPCTKADYMLGKWVGVFVPMLITVSLPSLVFYGYGVLSWRDHGFLSQDRWLLLQLLAILPLSAAIHTSLILAISSIFRQGRIAGATYAGLYVLTNIMTVLMRIIWTVSGGEAGPAVKTLFYCSVDGVQIGLAKAILGTDGSGAFGMAIPVGIRQVPAPPLLPYLLFVLCLTGGCMWFVWRRVRAVEVV